MAQPQFRLALTISGAVALGAYEGGALAALLVAVQELCNVKGRPIRVDAIGGASAGSITGLLAARTLLAGLDPVQVMHEAWVKRDSLTNLRTHDAHAPLSVESVRQMAVDLIDPKGKRKPPQRSQVRLDMALACLRGLTYRLVRLHGQPIESTTYLDWATFTFKPNRSPKDFLEPEGASPLDFALASGANELGFPPRVINRKRRQEDRDQIDRLELIDPPPDWDGWLWYTDGGTVNNEPLGRTFDVANAVDAAEPKNYRRLHLLIHPHPTAHPKDAEWMDPKNQPAWTTTLVRGDHIQRSQSLYADLRNAEKVNSRLEWARMLKAALRDLLAADDSGAWRNALAGAIGTIEGQKQAFRAKDPNPESAAPVESVEGSVVDLFERAVDYAAGLDGKQPAEIDVISPLLLDEAAKVPVEELLAGEFLGHFGGFLDEKLRMSDFVLGYRSTQKWLERLPDYLPKEQADRAVEAVKNRFEFHWNDYHFGKETLGTLPLRDKIDFARLVMHIGRVAAGEMIFRHRP